MADVLHTELIDPGIRKVAINDEQLNSITSVKIPSPISVFARSFFSDRIEKLYTIEFLVSSPSSQSKTHPGPESIKLYK
jgi:hypothetical protein